MSHGRRSRRAMAMPAILALMMIVIPLVFSFALRSRAALDWYAKLQDQKQALLLATEGEVAALQTIQSAGAAVAGNRRVSQGGMEWRLKPLGPGSSGQLTFLAAGEGVFLGEERMVVQYIERFGTSPAFWLLGHDRRWVLPGTGGGTLTNLDALALDQDERVRQYIETLRRENQTPLTQYLNRLRSQAGMLATNEVVDRWSEVTAALTAAKCEVSVSP